MPSFIAIGKYLLLKIFDSALQSVIDKAISRLARLPLPGFHRLHFVELKSTISRMPFIYHHDLPSDVLTEFVHIDMCALDSGLKRKPQQRVEKEYEERIRDHNHVLIFGQGGVGKTTFLRYSILKFIQERRQMSRFKKKLIPFYVPLKAIDNSEELPILKHLLKRNSILSGPRGMLRLVRLASEYRVMLCMDGYDEIPFPNAAPENNFVLRELRLLVSGKRDLGSIRLSKEEALFYERMTYCRVWLTSRLEFFRDNALEIDKHTLAIEILGVPAQNRAHLVKIIFGRYEPVLRDKEITLNHELFIHRIDRSGHEELIKLSFNPLFLTVMAYIYVKEVLEKGHYDIGIAHEVAELVEKCVELLLIDLDKERARGLSDAHREGLLCRRNEWIREKREFLRFLALRSLVDVQPTFSTREIEKYTIMFFKDRPDLTESESILRSLRSTGTLPGFVDQLIYCDLFVQVERAGSTVSYDFPHRKFREVLAARYLGSLPERQTFLLRFVDEPQLQESLYGMFEAAAYLRDEILSLLCMRAAGSSNRQYGIAVDTCLDRIQDKYAHSERLWCFFLDRLRDRKAFWMPRRVLERVKPEDRELVKVVGILQQAIEQQDSFRTALSCELLRDCYGSAVLIEVLSKYILEREALGSILGLVLYEYFRAGGQLSDAMLQKSASDHAYVLEIAGGLAASMGREENRSYLEAFGKVIGAVDPSHLVPIFCVIRRASMEVIPLLNRNEIIPWQYEAESWLCQEWLEAVSRKPLTVVTKDAILNSVSLYSGNSRPTLLEFSKALPNPVEQLTKSLWKWRGSFSYDENSFLDRKGSRNSEMEQSQDDAETEHLDNSIPPELRKLLLHQSTVHETTYQRVRQEIERISTVKPSLPVFFE